MDYNTIDQVNYSEQVFSDTSPVKASVINELRCNVNNCLEYLDMHRGSQRVDSHGLVTSSTAGFAPTTIFALLSSLDDQLKELEELVTHDPFPPCSIAIWNGEYEDIPKDWIACQGIQGSPDMRGRFPVGVDKTKPYKTIGGSDTISIDLAVALKYHNHSYQNAFHPLGVAGPYEWFTKFGKLYFPSVGSYDWDNYPCYLPETTETAGKSAGSGVKKAKFLPASIAKWYIMRLPNNAQLNNKKYTVTVIQPKNGEIKTNYSGEVSAGTNLIITVVPKNDLYVINEIKVNGKTIQNNVVRAVNEDLTITAKISYKYGEEQFSTPGTYSFTVPPEVTRLKVAMAGGGGGCSITCEDDNDNHDYTATAGGASSFGDTLVTVTGGGAGRAIIRSRGTTAHGIAGAGGSPNGNAGTVCNVNYYAGQGTVFTSVGGKGFAKSFTKQDGTYGQGGSATTNINGADDALSNAAGGSGGYTTTYVNVTPGATYNVVVGAAGANRCAYWEGNSYTFYSPTAGFVMLAYGGDIQG